jgi:hypothetical protein
MCRRIHLRASVIKIPRSFLGEQKWPKQVIHWPHPGGV